MHVSFEKILHLEASFMFPRDSYTDTLMTRLVPKIESDKMIVTNGN